MSNADVPLDLVDPDSLAVKDWLAGDDPTDDGWDYEASWDVSLDEIAQWDAEEALRSAEDEKHRTAHAQLKARVSGLPCPARPRKPQTAGGRGIVGEGRRARARAAFLTDNDLRVFLAEHTTFDYDDLIRPTPRGRLTDSERARRDELAHVVAAARIAGAGFEPLARVLRRSLATVHQLARDGAAGCAS